MSIKVENKSRASLFRQSQPAVQKPEAKSDRRGIPAFYADLLAQRTPRIAEQKKINEFADANVGKTGESRAAPKVAKGIVDNPTADQAQKSDQAQKISGATENSTSAQTREARAETRLGLTAAPESSVISDRLLRGSLGPDERFAFQDSTLGRDGVAASSLMGSQLSRGLSGRDAFEADTEGIIMPGQLIGRQSMMPQAVANPVDPAAMSTVRAKNDPRQLPEAEQYKYYQELTTAQARETGKASAWKTGEGEVNLIGIRDFYGNAEGQTVKDVSNDLVVAAYKENGQDKVKYFRANVDGGKLSQKDIDALGIQADSLGTPGLPDGGTHEKADYVVPHIADGHYQDVFKKGKVGGGVDDGLVQSGLLACATDFDNDGTAVDDIAVGRGRTFKAGPEYNYQFHQGNSVNEKVGSSSAGCQTVCSEQWKDFQDLICKSDQDKYNYTLVSADKLPKSSEANRQIVDERGLPAALDDSVLTEQRLEDGIGIIRQPYKFNPWTKIG